LHLDDPLPSRMTLKRRPRATVTPTSQILKQRRPSTRPLRQSVVRNCDAAFDYAFTCAPNPPFTFGFPGDTSTWSRESAPYKRGAVVWHRGKHYVAIAALNSAEPGLYLPWLIYVCCLPALGTNSRKNSAYDLYFSPDTFRTARPSALNPHTRPKCRGFVPGSCNTVLTVARVKLLLTLPVHSPCLLLRARARAVGSTYEFECVEHVRGDARLQLWRPLLLHISKEVQSSSCVRFAAGRVAAAHTRHQAAPSPPLQTQMNATISPFPKKFRKLF